MRSKKQHRAEMEGIACIYGSKVPDEVDTPKAEKPKKPNPSPKEDYEQTVVATWLDKHGYLYTASANGGSRHHLEAQKLKRMGVKPGVPDLLIFEPRGPHKGMFVEMKRRKGWQMADTQKYWIEQLNKKGYFAVVARGSDEAILQIKRYMELKE